MSKQKLVTKEEMKNQILKRRKRRNYFFVLTSLTFILFSFGYPKSPVLPIIFGACFLFVGIRIPLKIRKWKKIPEMSQLTEEVKSELKSESKSFNKAKKLLVDYEAGLDSYNLKGSYVVAAVDNGLALNPQGMHDNVLIPWSELNQVEAGSEDELRSRITVSRVLLIGVFALGARKEKKKDFYLSVVTNNEVGLFKLNNSLSDNRRSEEKLRIFATTCNSKIMAAKNNLNNQNSSKIESTKNTVLDEIEKLGELLDKGLITQEEFEQMKMKILEN